MKRSIPTWQIIGFLFTSILGTFLHFLFDLTGGNIIAGVFSAVNESIWEHTKLLFYPMFFFGVIEYFFWGKDIPSFWCIKLIGILTGLILIPVIYYTYTGILGVSADWFNIIIFFLVAGLVYFLETKQFENGFPCILSPAITFICICIISVLFTLFTFAPPHIPFFADPLTGNYGYLS